MKDETYYFHQTPPELCLQLIEHVSIDRNDNACEPFRGEGAFFNAIRKKTVNVDWCEIEDGRDYKEMADNYDWIITNPPFEKNGSFWKLLWELAPKVNKGLALLGNQYCFTCLTPKRIKMLNDVGLYLNKVIVCNVKKWHGRYYFMIFTKQDSQAFGFIEGNF